MRSLLRAQEDSGGMLDIAYASGTNQRHAMPFP